MAQSEPGYPFERASIDCMRSWLGALDSPVSCRWPQWLSRKQAAVQAVLSGFLALAPGRFPLPRIPTLTGPRIRYALEH